MPLRLKLALSYLLIGLIPVLAMAFVVYQQASEALRVQTLNALEAVANIKQQQLLDNWQERHNQISTLASNLSNSYDGLDTNALLSSSNYDRPIFENFIATFGYRELKLVLPDGTVMFSLRRGDDYQNNLDSQALRNTPLAQLVKQSAEQRQILIRDLLYNQLSQAPTQYLAAPIGSGDELQMTLVLELPIAPLNAVMQTRQGLGEQGETYLVGSDSRLRSDSVRFPELQVNRSLSPSTALTANAISRALAGQQGRLEEAGLDGNPALKVFVPLEFAGNHWALIAEMDQQQALAPVRQLMWQMLLLGLLTVVAVAAATWLMSRSVMRPLGGEPSNMSALARRLAAGELNLTTTDGQHAGLMQALQHMAQAWREVIEKLRHSSQAIDHASGDILTAAGQTSERLDQQQEALEMVVSAVDQMASTVQEIARNAAASATSSSAARGAFGQMQGTLEQMIGQQGRLLTDISQAGNVVDTLANDALQIGSVLAVIRGIAEQTNLLALNAAIEAARAGEQGRGFAVVADEVRTLASRTQASTQEIHSMIEGLQGASQQAVKVMQDSRGYAEHGVTQAESAGQALVSICALVASISDMSLHIAEAAREQSAVSDEINQRIISVADVAARTVELAESTLGRGRAAGEDAHRLEAIVGQFKF